MGDGKNSVRVLMINGQPFVAGLYWKALTTPRRFRKEAKEVGRREGMDIVVLRETPQFAYAGFVKAGHGVRKGQYSVATALAGELGNNWFGVFRVADNEYLVTGVNQHAIIPSGDRIVDARSAIDFCQELISQLRNRDNFRVYAPDELDIPVEQVEERHLDEILNKRRYPKAYRLQPLTMGLSTRQWSYLGAVVIVMSIAVVFYAQWQKKVREAERQAELQRQQMLEELEAESGRKADVAALEYPWVHTPNPMQTMEACLSLIESAPQVLGGWTFVRAGCNGDEVVVSYRRTPYATVNHFIHEAKVVGYEFFEVDESGELGVAGHQLDLPRYGDEPLLESELAVNGLRSYYQARGAELHIGEWSSSGYDTELIEAGAKNWKAFDFDVQAPLLETVDLRGFYQPGLRFTEVLMDASQENRIVWVLRGRQYVQ